MTRALRAAIVGVALFSPIALSACSAGQVTQTGAQLRDRTGAQAEVGDITLRAVRLEYPRSESYDAGDDAELSMAIVNTGDETDTLVSIDGEGFADVEITGAETSTGTNADEIELPPDTTVFVGSEATTTTATTSATTIAAATVTDLDDSLSVGEYVTLVLTFENAGEVTVRATVATPYSEVERGESFDFHYSEEEGAEGAEDIARERESDIGDED